MDYCGLRNRLQIACVLGAIISVSFPVTYGAKILVVPVDGSHWINMKILIEELRHHGHNITALYSSKAWYIKESPDLYQSITVQLQGGTTNFDDSSGIQHFLQRLLTASRYGLAPWAFIQVQRQTISFLREWHLWAGEFITRIFEDKELLKQLEEANFDLVLTDPALGIGSMLAYYLKAPLVYNVRWITMGEAHFLFAPSPLSYIPLLGSHLTDKMSFLQRIRNVLQHLLELFISEFFIHPIYNEACRRYLGMDMDIKTVLLQADVWLMRVDFVFEFPRPTMPNIVYIGGFQCKSPKPLPVGLEEFVQTSGKYGIIVMSLGSLVNSLPLDITMKIAEAFAQVPQKVIWRHNGEIPPNVANNTLLVKWIPQNDLLGHPKARAFVAHGGTNGIYEAIYHGVPVVGLPLFYDQFDNLIRLKVRGAAKMLDAATMQSTDLLQALNEVINNTSYRVNMQKLSALHRDQLESPMQRAVFWIEYVARHRGAAHLRSEFYRLPWYAHHCVDVVALLLSVFLITAVLIVLILKKFCNIVGKKKQKTQ
ncbi:UDP-glucuronosyltransferase 2C1-like [Carcharodon carcharias]|uniref:UDP-glucuronosyltransferase 2C1-like n=1 Tax=Carcharodon carcharias TaxID=13397 RepID=UPI001B7DD438|nr:UDP-glucuronosyltransferase 2C1-like [Carcharodon carcharias]